MSEPVEMTKLQFAGKMIPENEKKWIGEKPYVLKNGEWVEVFFRPAPAVQRRAMALYLQRKYPWRDFKFNQ